jgi:outer membrane protein OmpA-like peptidoglycan-associated protein
MMKRILAVGWACAALVAMTSGCARRTVEVAPQPVAVSASPVGKTTGATVRSAIAGAAATGQAATTIARQMDKQAQDLAFDLPGAIVQRLGGGIIVTLPEGMLFAQDADELTPASRDNLRRLANSLEKYPNTRIVIVGHSDSQSPRDKSLDLSDRRAKALADFLEQIGINRARMTALGRGDAEPIASNDTDAGRQWNRRIEIAIYADEATRFGTSP